MMEEASLNCITCTLLVLLNRVLVYLAKYSLYALSAVLSFSVAFPWISRHAWLDTVSLR